MISLPLHYCHGFFRVLALALSLAALVFPNTPAAAIGIVIQGLPNGGNSIGQYVISGQTYWWLGIEPGATPLDNGLQAAYVTQVKDGWLSQVYQRPVTPAADIKQPLVIQYVLDANLPWDTLAGASGRFLEQNGDFHNYTTNDPFLNAMFAAEAFIADVYPNTSQTDFTDLSGYTDPFAGLGDATDDARSALFQSILADVAAKDAAGYFANYTPQHGYNTVSVFSNPGSGFMDGLFISSFAPVPEPGSALLLAATGLLATLGRRRVVR